MRGSRPSVGGDSLALVVCCCVILALFGIAGAALLVLPSFMHIAAPVAVGGCLGLACGFLALRLLVRPPRPTAPSRSICATIPDLQTGVSG